MYPRVSLALNFSLTLLTMPTNPVRILGFYASANWVANSMFNFFSAGHLHPFIFKGLFVAANRPVKCMTIIFRCWWPPIQIDIFCYTINVASQTWNCRSILRNFINDQFMECFPKFGTIQPSRYDFLCYNYTERGTMARDRESYVYPFYYVNRET